MSEALIGLGANLGDPLATFAAAIPRFADGADARLLARSDVYRTEPWGDANQPRYLNLCLRVETRLAPRALLARALATEAAFGRDRSRERRWGPRRLDIDLLAYEGVSLDEPGLTLPHPRMRERAFVLAPLLDVAPDWRIGGETVRDLAGRIDLAGVERLAFAVAPEGFG